MNDCLFCKFVNGSIPVKAVHEDDVCVGFADIHPQAPTHLLLIPREHFANAAAAPAELLGRLFKAATIIAERELPGGYRIVVNTGADGGQTVHHLHLHILGGRAMRWPPG